MSSSSRRTARGQQTAKLTADDGASDDRFGIQRRDIDAGMAVIGAYGDDDNWQRLRQRVCLRAAGRTAPGQQTAKLTADDGASEDRFGSRVALDAGVVVIGAYLDDDNGSDSGSAYVFVQQADGTWQQAAKLTASDGAESDTFGLSVAIDGDVVVIGDHNQYGGSSGSAYVFESMTGADCNNNGICDADDLLDGTSADCNVNGIPDECDVSDGTSYDCDDDLVPDECQLGDGSATDCDGDGTLDHCQIADDPDQDCDEDGVLDSCGIADGSVEDCNQNGIPDSCDLADDTDLDCDEDGTLDHCQFADDPDLDCNENGVLDSCEMELVLSETAKLTADDGASGDNFGYSVATSGGVAVIGAQYGDGNDSASGSVYVYEQQGDGTWLQTATLTADDGASGDRFGFSVALDAGVAVIGAWRDDDDNGTDSGSAYVYEQQGDGTWQQTAKLTADDGASSDLFGRSVATSGGVAVIGAWSDDDNGSWSGSAYVYEQQGDGTWQQTAKLTADDGASNDYFGYSVATSGGVAVIGAYYDDDNGSNSGSAYVFEQQADGTWSQTAKLTADDGALGDHFGYSVATSGGVAVIGAFRDHDDNGSYSGSAYVYEQQADGTWSQTAKLTADDGASQDYFGRSLALDAGLAVIGAYSDDDNGYNSGSAYVFEQQVDGTWQQTAKLTADDGASYDRFGWSVATSGGVAVIGACRDDDDNGSYSGSAYVYEQQSDGTVEDCNENGIPDSCDIANGGDADGDGYLDECECAADIAGPGGQGFPDGIVGVNDLLAVIGYWGSSSPGGDVDGDGFVGVHDLLLVISAWGPCS